MGRRTDFSFGYTDFERFVEYLSGDFIFHSKIIMLIAGVGGSKGTQTFSESVDINALQQSRGFSIIEILNNKVEIFREQSQER